MLPLPSRLGLCRSMDKSTKPSAAGDQKRGASPFLQAWGQAAHRRQAIAICKRYNARMKFKSNVVSTVGGAPLAAVRQCIENQKSV